MKKVIILFFIVIVSTLSYAQMENIKITNDSSLIVNRVYVGMLSGSLFATDSIYVDKFVNLHFGAEATWQMNPYVSFTGFGVFNTSLVSNWDLQRFSVKITPTDKWLLQFGNMATPSTEQRPHPVSAGCQFETWSEAQIPGSAPGAKLYFMPNKNLIFGGGVAVRDNESEYHGKVKIKNFTLSGYYGLSEQKSGLAFTYKSDKIYNTLVWKDSDVLANIFVFKLVPKIKLDFYADMGYDLVQEDLVRGEWGFLKNFSSKYAKGLLGLGYQHETKTVNGYVFVHL